MAAVTMEQRKESLQMYHQLSIKISNAFKKALSKKLAALGCLGLIEQDRSIIAYFHSSADILTINRELAILESLFGKAGYKNAFSFDHTIIPDEDWNSSWKKSFRPINIGDGFTILPPWGKKVRDRINLIIDPAMAFGTGHHGTTRSCLVLMEQYAKGNQKRLFLDVGTGTGILAIAARHLGYQRVMALDTDPLAVDATKKNAALNRATGIDVVCGTIEDIKDTFDTIAANLVTDVLVRTAPSFAVHLDVGGIAILSRMLMGQERTVIRAMQGAGLSLIRRYHDEKWVSLVVGH